MRHNLAACALAMLLLVNTAKGSTYQPNRSYYYGYDDLHRLIEAQRGPQLDAQGMPEHSTSAQGYTEWTMDILGNWIGDELLGGRVELDANLDVISDARHAVDSANRITSLTVDEVGQAFVNDANGNLVFDGQYVYFHDAWNRLTEVDAAGTLDTGDFNEAGQLAPVTGHGVGDLILQNVYDGLGRLIETRRPDETPTSGPDPLCRVEAYYYDGVRRLQTTVGTETLLGTTWQTDREYIQGPDYVDEFVAQVADPAGTPQFMYTLQDANYNLLALLSDTQSPTVLAEYTYDPYGQPVFTSEPGLSAGTWNTVGHQGLFFYPFDSTGSPMAVGKPGLYYNRNRWYSPEFGRFAQRDPNETAMLISRAMLMNAESALIAVQLINPSSHFGDGMNLYQYQRSNPLLTTDPMGLDMFDEVDDWTSDRLGNIMYTLGELNENATLGLNFAKDLAMSFLPGSGLYDAFKSVQVIANGKGGFWDAVNIATAAFPFVKSASKLVGLKSLFAAKKYAVQSRNFALPIIQKLCFAQDTLVLMGDGTFKPISDIGVLDSVAVWDSDLSARRGLDDEDSGHKSDLGWTIQLELTVETGVTCEATLFRSDEWVRTHKVRAGGTMECELSEAGMRGRAKVLNVSPAAGCIPEKKAGVVTGVFITKYAPVLDLWIAGQTEPLGATPTHPFFSETRGTWTPAGELQPGELLRMRDGTATFVRALRRPADECVYNLEVDQAHTFYVSRGGLLVHNWCLLGKGSTGQAARNLKEQLAIAQAMADPLAGAAIKLDMTDPRWLKSGGWKKFRQNINGVEVHYLVNEALGAIDDFKIK